IPAFGVETSKFLPTIDLKVQYHNLVINSFMKRFGIVPESPGLVLDSPVLKYLVLSVNAQTPIVVKENETLDLRAGDSINVTHIESNYERGLSLDILGYGDLNDYRKDFEIFRDTTLIVRKDNHKFAEIPIRVSTARSPAAPVKSPSPPPPVKPREPDTVDYFVVENRGRRLLLADGETLNLVKGETLKIVGVLPPTPPSSGVKVNFKGFVGDKTNNTGEDRGYEIDTAADLMERYSLQNRGEQYQIIASEGDRVYGRLLLHLSAPRMDYLVLRLNGDGHLLLRPDERIRLSPEDRICLEEVQTNLPGGEDLHLSINGTRVKRNESRKLKELCTAPHGAPQPADIMTGALVLGRIYITMK
ncbi:MAG: hypothetical protein JW821_17145, partial [Deltaproteobacteria bacterium]|nr:hypothetical protein [Deltaproteobacteria bacterium]